MANPEAPNQSLQWWQQWLDGLAARHAAFPVGEDKHAIDPYWKKKDGQYTTAENGCVLEEHIAAGGHIGIIPGRLNCLVIDIDVPKGPDNPEVDEAVAFVIEQLGLPLLRYDTPSGGVHLWYRTENPQWRSRNLYMGDKHFGELRCDAGYIVAWDIQRVAGGLEYWRDATPVTEAKRQALLPKRPALASDDEEVAQTPSTAPEGQRNDTLNRQAFSDFSKSKTPAEAAYAAINNIAEAMENPNPQKRDEILATMRSAAKGALGDAEGTAPDAIKLVNIAKGDGKPINWLWHEYIPEGEITVLAGRGGAGKSTLALTFAAIVAGGAKWPDGSSAKRGNVVVMSTEDDIAKVQIPRCQAAIEAVGAHDPLPIETVPWDRHSSISTVLLPLLAQLEDSGKPPALLIIDPLIEIMARGNSNAVNEVRECLHPIQTFAARTMTAVIGITHLAKYSSEADAVERVLGSSAWTAKPRALLLAHYDRQSSDPRKLVRAKENLGPEGGGYAYDLEIDALGRSTVKFGEELIGDANKLTAPKKGGLSKEEIEEGDGVFGELIALYAKPGAQRPDGAVFPSATFTERTGWHSRKIRQYRELKGYVSRKANDPFKGHWWFELEDDE